MNASPLIFMRTCIRHYKRVLGYSTGLYMINRVEFKNNQARKGRSYMFEKLGFSQKSKRLHFSNLPRYIHHRARSLYLSNI